MILQCLKMHNFASSQLFTGWYLLVFFLNPWFFLRFLGCFLLLFTSIAIWFERDLSLAHDLQTLHLESLNQVEQVLKIRSLAHSAFIDKVHPASSWGSLAWRLPLPTLSAKTILWQLNDSALHLSTKSGNLLLARYVLPLLFPAHLLDLGVATLDLFPLYQDLDEATVVSAGVSANGFAVVQEKLLLSAGVAEFLLVFYKWISIFSLSQVC